MVIRSEQEGTTGISTVCSPHPGATKASTTIVNPTWLCGVHTVYIEATSKFLLDLLRSPRSRRTRVNIGNQVHVTPDSVTLLAFGQETRLTARVVDRDGRTLAEAPVAWGSRDASVATVDGAGVVRAVGNGTTQVTAASGHPARTRQACQAGHAGLGQQLDRGSRPGRTRGGVSRIPAHPARRTSIGGRVYRRHSDAGGIPRLTRMSSPPKALSRSPEAAAAAAAAA